VGPVDARFDLSRKHQAGAQALCTGGRCRIRTYLDRAERPGEIEVGALSVSSSQEQGTVASGLSVKHEERHVGPHALLEVNLVVWKSRSGKGDIAVGKFEEQRPWGNN
jgi:hypothetical protein